MTELRESTGVFISLPLLKSHVAQPTLHFSIFSDMFFFSPDDCRDAFSRVASEAFPVDSMRVHTYSSRLTEKKDAKKLNHFAVCRRIYVYYWPDAAADRQPAERKLDEWVIELMCTFWMREAYARQLRVE